MAVTARVIALREAIEQDEELLITVEPPAPQTTHTYTVHASHPPQAVALNNMEQRGIVSAINCTGPCEFILRDSKLKVLIHVDAPDGFDAPLAIPFSGPLVALLNSHSSVSFTLIS